MDAPLERAFLDSIVETPDDLAPRWIFADWLDDHGDADRAEFIRVQIELAGLAPNDARRGRLGAREWTLLQNHEAAWRSALPALDGVTWEGFTRGFAESVFVADVEAFEAQAAAAFAAAPVRRVRVGQIDAAATRWLARSPLLARVAELNLGNYPAMGDGVRALATSPHVAGLSSLLLHYNELGPLARTVAESTNLANLTELYLSGNQLEDDVGAALGRSPTLPRLAVLDLRDNLLGDEGMCSLAYHGRRVELMTLWLTNNRIGEGGAWALAGTPYLPRLAHLYLNYNPLGNEGAAAFACSPQRTALRDLDLRGCDIRDRGGRDLAASKYLDELELIWLGGNRMRADTQALLRKRFGERLRW